MQHRTIQYNAYAKINLSLEVIGRRDDGYHNIVSVMQMVDLHDTLTFTPNDSLSVQCDDPTLLTKVESNLVWRAADLLRRTAGIEAGAHIEMQKMIPVSAGLGGGSSDAAATLRGLNDLWDLKLSMDDLHGLAGQIGSDVPFFLHGPTALVEGRGEKVTRLPSPPCAWAVLASQPYPVENKTRRLYETLSRKDLSDGNTTQQIISAILRGDCPAPSLLHNTFERAAYSVFTNLHKVRDKMARSGGGAVHLSGSGPTLYSLFSDTEGGRARALYQSLQAGNIPCFLTRTLTSISRANNAGS